MLKRTMALLLFTCSAGLVSAQSDPPFVESIDVRIINVDVVVTDDDGNPVSGLTASDFEIYENRKLQPITNFAEYRTTVAAVGATTDSAAASVATRPPEKRRLVFFIDRLQLTEKENREDFFRGLRAFAEDSMRDGDEAEVFFYGTSLHTLVDMTDDRGRIMEAIDEIEEESGLRTDLESMEISEIEARARINAGDQDAAAMEELDRRQAAQRAYDAQRRKTLAINTVIQSVTGLEGRKVLVLVTHHLSKLPGLEFGYPSTEFNARKMMDAVVDNANAAGVTVYGFYPKGLTKDLPSAAVREQSDSQSYQLLMNEAETIDSIATRTGGISALGGKLSAVALDRTTRHLDNYYSLAYRAPDKRDDRERKIRVEVSQPGLAVLVRSSVIDKSDEEIARDRLVAATLFGESESKIGITARQIGGRKSGLTTWTIPLEIEIPIGQLTTLPTVNGFEGSFRVMAAAANAEGDVSEVAEKAQAFTIPADQIEAARAGHFTYEIEIKVRDTSDRAVVAIWDEIDKESGYAEVALDLGKVSNGVANPGGSRPTGRRSSGRAGRWPH